MIIIYNIFKMSYTKKGDREMKKTIIILFCFLLLAPLPSCRKKSSSEKQFEKTTKARMVNNH